VLLGLSAVLCAFVTLDGLSFAHKITCPPSPPPVAWRQGVVYAGLALYFASALPALLLLRRGRSVGTFVAVLLAGVAIAVSCATYLIPAFSAALC
jgi:hypothetical protein